MINEYAIMRNPECSHPHPRFFYLCMVAGGEGGRGSSGVGVGGGGVAGGPVRTEDPRRTLGSLLLTLGSLLAVVLAEQTREYRYSPRGLASPARTSPIELSELLNLFFWGHN